MTALRTAYAALGLALAFAIVWALRDGNFSAAGSWLTTDPWGIVTLGDLYLGFSITAAVILLFERSWLGILWVLPLPFLGNVWTIVWFVWRLPALSARLYPRN